MMKIFVRDDLFRDWLDPLNLIVGWSRRHLSLLKAPQRIFNIGDASSSTFISWML